MEKPVKSGRHLIRPVVDDDWPRIEPLWLALYEHQQAHGMLLALPPNAYELWAESFRPLIDRFGFVLVAEQEGVRVGFCAGRMRPVPPYFGGYQVGYLSELFVLDSERGRGIAGELLSAATDWFQTRGIFRLELQVVAKNARARDFYLRRGWVEELTQMVWQG